MTFAIHTFETNPSAKNLGFAFHENVGEGQEVYFLAKFSEDTTDQKSVAESIFGAIVDSFRVSNVSDSYDRFEDALKAANLEVRKNRQKLPTTPDIVVTFFDFHNLYLSQSGQSEAYLVRGDVVSQISETPEPGDGLFLNILSGQVSLGDTVLLSSNRLLRIVTTTQLSDIFARKDFDEAVGMLRHEVSMNSEDDLLVTAIGIGKKSEVGTAGFLSKMVSKISGPSRESELATEMLAETIETLSEEETEEDEIKLFDEDGELIAEESALESPKDSIRPPRRAGGWKLFKNLPPKRNLMIIAGTVLGVLILGIAIRSIASFESAETAQLREELSIAREALQQADTLLIQGDRQSASEMLQTSQNAVQKILSSKSKNFRSDAQFLLADIQEKQLQVENAKKVVPQLLADLGVKNDNIEASGLLELRGNLYAYDLKNVYKTIRNIVERGLPISDKETILAAAARTDQNALLFLTDSPRIIEYRDGVINSMSTEDETWKKGVDIKTYGRYAYILDPVENQIWKYERRRAKYAPAIAYNQGADLSRAVSFTIDGSLYVLSDDGTVQKLFRGVKTDYAFRDLPSVSFIGKNLKIYTSGELDFLYVLDPDNSRILIFVKGDRFATYKKQILFDLPNARDFVIDDSGQRVNLLTDDKIYEFSL